MWCNVKLDISCLWSAFNLLQQWQNTDRDNVLRGDDARGINAEYKLSLWHLRVFFSLIISTDERHFPDFLCNTRSKKANISTTWSRDTIPKTLTPKLKLLLKHTGCFSALLRGYRLNSFPQSINQSEVSKVVEQNLKIKMREPEVKDSFLCHSIITPGSIISMFLIFLSDSRYKQIQKCAYLANGNTPVKYLKNCTLIKLYSGSFHHLCYFYYKWTSVPNILYF